jgi:hypothetical protein
MIHSAPHLVDGIRHGNLYLSINHDLRAGIASESTITALLASAASSNKRAIAHARGGHVPIAVLLNMAKNKVVTGLEELLGDDGVKHRDLCDTCCVCKVDRQPKTSGFRLNKVSRFLQVVHSDLSGPLPVKSIQGNWYCNTFVDTATYYLFPTFQPNKTASYQLVSLKKFMSAVGRPETWRTDNGGDMIAKITQDTCMALNINHETTNAYTPWENGMIERAWRTIYNSVRCMLHMSGLSRGRW